MDFPRGRRSPQPFGNRGVRPSGTEVRRTGKGGGVMNNDCIFCKIATGAAPAERLYEDDRAVAFRDIHPQAPVHVLVIPRKHIPAISKMDESDSDLVGHLVWVARQVAAQEGIDETGFRLVVNDGRDGNQTVGHLHVHLLGGRSLQWPPG